MNVDDLKNHEPAVANDYIVAFEDNEINIHFNGPTTLHAIYIQTDIPAKFYLLTSHDSSTYEKVTDKDGIQMV